MRRRTNLGFCRAVALICAVANGSVVVASAQGQPRGESSSTEETAPPHPASLVERASKIRALVQGTLDPFEDAEQVLEIDLRWKPLIGDGAGLRALFRQAARERAASPRARRRLIARRNKATLPADPEQAAYEQLRRAYLEWFGLPIEQRQQRLTEHKARQQQLGATREQAEKRLQTIEQRIEALSAALDGKRPLHPNLLSLSLTEGDSLAEDARRRGEFGLEMDDTQDVEREASLAVKLRIAQRRLDALWSRVIQLSDEDLSALMTVEAPAEEEAKPPTLIEAHGTEDQVREAALARAEALEEAQKSRDDRQRAVAAEKARLLAVQEALARRSRQVDKTFDDDEAHVARFRKLVTEVDQLAERSVLEGDKTREAVQLYRQVLAALQEARPILAHSLESVEPGAELEIPSLQGDLKVQTEDLLALRDEVRAARAALAQHHKDASWTVIDHVMDSLSDLGAAREVLFDMIPSELQARRYTAEEASIEVEQIALNLKHVALSIPRRVRGWLSGITTSPLKMLSLVGTLLQLGALLFAFVFWRRSADRMLGGDENQTDDEGPFAGFFWYLQRIREPLEWLVLLKLVLFVTDLRDFPGVNYIRVIVLWVFGGWAVILLVDAIAARRHQRIGYRSKTEQLRLKSLKLVGWTVIVLGLLLSLTSEAVGQGAIYGWVVRLCLLLVLPVVLTLIVWWQDTVFRIMDAREDPNPVVRWVQLNKRGWKHFIAAAVGGVYLFGWGVFRWLLGWASRSDLTQRFRAYLFRKQVARKAEESDQDEREPIAADVYNRFDPSVQARRPIASIAATQLEDLTSVVNADRSSLSAVVGERGAGKSTFLQRLSAGVGERATNIDCPEHFEDLIREIAKALGSAPSKAGIRDALRTAGRRVVCIDNVQRLIRPAIGGLDALDALTEFVRAVDGHVSWVLAIERPAWQYFRRARTGRVFFDHIVHLPKWTEQQIGELIRERSAQAGVTPSFEGLVVPRQLDAVPEEDTETHREDGYYRVLWDSSDGNPAVALHYWRESLFQGGDGQPVVHLFREPASDRIEQLPPAMHFVLRAIVQLDRATPDDIVTCTNLPVTDVADALRLAFSRGFVEQRGDRICVTWPWYRTLTDYLRRQHLLVAT